MTDERKREMVRDRLLALEDEFGFDAVQAVCNERVE